MWPEGAHSITKTTKRPQTAGTLFKNSMQSLMKTLASKEPFYIRDDSKSEAMKNTTQIIANPLLVSSFQNRILPFL